MKAGLTCNFRLKALHYSMSDMGYALLARRNVFLSETSCPQNWLRPFSLTCLTRTQKYSFWSGRGTFVNMRVSVEDIFQSLACRRLFTENRSNWQLLLGSSRPDVSSIKNRSLHCCTQDDRFVNLLNRQVASTGVSAWPSIAEPTSLSSTISPAIRKYGRNTLFPLKNQWRNNVQQDFIVQGSKPYSWCCREKIFGTICSPLVLLYTWFTGRRSFEGRMRNVSFLHCFAILGESLLISSRSFRWNDALICLHSALHRRKLLFVWW